MSLRYRPDKLFPQPACPPILKPWVKTIPQQTMVAPCEAKIVAEVKQYIEQKNPIFGTTQLLNTYNFTLSCTIRNMYSTLSHERSMEQWKLANLISKLNFHKLIHPIQWTIANPVGADRPAKRQKKSSYMSA